MTSYNNDQRHGVVTVLPDGRIIAYGQNNAYVDGSGNFNINVRTPDLREGEELLDIQFNMTPAGSITGTHQGVKIAGNVVGMTLYGVPSGGTVSSRAIVLGH